MYRVRQEDLPFQGSSHQFVGAEHGQAVDRPAAAGAPELPAGRREP